MKSVIILGAGGNIARHVIGMLTKRNDIKLTLFLRSKNRLRNSDISQCRIIEDDVLDINQLEKAVTGQDIVYANLAGDLETMAKNILKAMDSKGIKN
ncbi:MAG: NAD(P)H-binding protein [Brevinematales bacterium]|jgi:saccharopine dehydrogenase-like NADP-dependent oxidoreductase